MWLTLVDVREDTTLGDGDVAKELVQLFIVADGELKVTRDDTGLLVVTGGVASQLEDLSSQVLEDSGEVDGSTCGNCQMIAIRQTRQIELTHQHRHAVRSCPCGGDGGHDRPGMRDLPWRSGCDDVSLRPKQLDGEDA